MRPLGLVGRSWRRGGEGEEGRAGEAEDGEDGSDDLRARRAALASFSSRDGMAFSSENDPSALANHEGWDAFLHGNSP